MLDRKFLRENRDLVTRAVALKNESVDIDAYYEADERRRAALQEIETLQAEANRANKAISEAKKAGADAGAAIAAMKDVSTRIKDLKAQTDALEAEVEALYLRIPNIPHPSAPEGGEENNQVVRTWGEPVTPDTIYKQVWGGTEYHPLQHRNALYVALNRLRTSLRVAFPDREVVERASSGWRLGDEVDACVAVAVRKPSA